MPIERRSHMETNTNHAAYVLDLAVGDLLVALSQCESTANALWLSARIQSMILKLEACDSAARQRADALSGMGMMVES